MFYPIIPGAHLYKDRREKELRPMEYMSRSERLLPTRWDNFLLRFGNLLIVTGEKVRSGSTYDPCAEPKAL